jgi:hypothetical protein
VEQIKSCGVPYQDLKKSMDEDLEVLCKFYAGNEWASDRPWSEDEDKDCKQCVKGLFKLFKLFKLFMNNS